MMHSLTTARHYELVYDLHPFWGGITLGITGPLCAAGAPYNHCNTVIVGSNKSNNSAWMRGIKSTFWAVFNSGRSLFYHRAHHFAAIYCPIHYFHYFHDLHYWNAYAKASKSMLIELESFFKLMTGPGVAEERRCDYRRSKGTTKKQQLFLAADSVWCCYCSSAIRQLAGKGNGRVLIKTLNCSFLCAKWQEALLFSDCLLMLPPYPVVDVYASFSLRLFLSLSLSLSLISVSLSLKCVYICAVHYDELAINCTR